MYSPTPSSRSPRSARPCFRPMSGSWTSSRVRSSRPAEHASEGPRLPRYGPGSGAGRPREAEWGSSVRRGRADGGERLVRVGMPRDVTETDEADDVVSLADRKAADRVLGHQLR